MGDPLPPGPYETGAICLTCWGPGAPFGPGPPPLYVRVIGEGLGIRPGAPPPPNGQICICKQTLPRPCRYYGLIGTFPNSWTFFLDWMGPNSRLDMSWDGGSAYRMFSGGDEDSCITEFTDDGLFLWSAGTAKVI